jgi:single-strand DNA-binding protein
MRSLNRASIIGRCGADPEVRYTADGTAVANLSVATSEEWKDKHTGEKKEKTEWHRVVFFRRPAEIVAEYVSKGDMIYIDGKIRTRSWKKDGENRYSTEIAADDFVLLSPKSDRPTRPEPSRQQQASPQDDVGFEDDIPF